MTSDDIIFKKIRDLDERLSKLETFIDYHLGSWVKPKDDTKYRNDNNR